MRPFTSLFRHYHTVYCDRCCRDSFREMCYVSSEKSYTCSECTYTIDEKDAFLESFDYESLCEEIKQQSEEKAKRLIVRYMLYCGAEDEDTYDMERIRYYYTEIMEQPRKDYKLFEHYPYDPFEDIE